MELTQKTFAERLDNLKALKSEKPEEFEELSAALREKGVECALIVPLLEVILEFDALRDVKYEQSSDVKYGQRFDFLVDGCFLVEAKPLGTNLDHHHAQIARYIKENPNINYGLLTNGVDYQIWLQRTFIESFAKCPLPHTGPVTKILELSLEGESTGFVLDVLRLLRKDRYAQSFEKIAAIAGFYAVGGKGKPHILHDDRQTNLNLRDRIKNAVAVQKGFYYDAIMAGKLTAGDKLRYKNECVEITVEVTKTGTVILRRGNANVLDMVAACRSEWKPMISLIAEKWADADAEFRDPVEIIKLALNKQKLHHQDKYREAFQRVG